MAELSEELAELLEQTRAARLVEWNKLAIALMGNEIDADEAIQDAFKATLRADPPLETEKEMHFYMRTAIKTSAFTLLKKRKRFAPAAEDGSSDVEPGPNALDRLIALEDAAQVERLAARASELIEALPADERALVEDFVLAEPRRRFREVSKRDGVPAPTLHYRLKAVLRKVAEGILSEVPNPETVLDIIRADRD